MFTCSICGKNIDDPIMYSMDPSHPICPVCVHKFDDLMKNPEKDSFLNAYSYFDSFAKASNDPYIKAALDYYLQQNKEKYQNIINDLSQQKIIDFIKKGNDELNVLREDIEKIKKQKEEKEIIEKQEREKKDLETLLDSLGLYTSVREYVTDKYLPRNYYVYNTHEEKVGEQIIHYYGNPVKIYPDIKDEEYEEIRKIVEEKEKLEEEKKRLISPEKEPQTETVPEINSFPIQPQDKQVSNIETEKKPRSLLLNSPEITESFAERLMKFLACFIWIGGFIISIVISRIPGHYSWETEFSWKTFWISILVFFLSGSFTWCMAELFGNLNSIAGILKEFRLDQYDDSDK